MAAGTEEKDDDNAKGKAKRKVKAKAAVATIPGKSKGSAAVKAKANAAGKAIAKAAGKAKAKAAGKVKAKAAGKAKGRVEANAAEGSQEPSLDDDDEDEDETQPVMRRPAATTIALRGKRAKHVDEAESKQDTAKPEEEKIEEHGDSGSLSTLRDRVKARKFGELYDSVPEAIRIQYAEASARRLCTDWIANISNRQMHC